MSPLFKKTEGVYKELRIEDECLHELTENSVCGECGEYIEGLFGEYEVNEER